MSVIARAPGVSETLFVADAFFASALASSGGHTTQLALDDSTRLTRLLPGRLVPPLLLLPHALPWSADDRQSRRARTKEPATSEITPPLCQGTTRRQRREGHLGGRTREYGRVTLESRQIKLVSPRELARSIWLTWFCRLAAAVLTPSPSTPSPLPRSPSTPCCSSLPRCSRSCVGSSAPSPSPLSRLSPDTRTLCASRLPSSPPRLLYVPALLVALVFSLSYASLVFG